MHEYPITQRIIKIAEEYAIKNGYKKVLKINIVAGDMCGYVPDTVEMYFNEISKGTLCEGGELLIERVEAKLKCRKCGEYFKRALFSFECPHCGGDGEPSDIGREFYVKSIEVEEDE